MISSPQLIWGIRAAFMFIENISQHFKIILLYEFLVIFLDLLLRKEEYTNIPLKAKFSPC